MEIDYTDIRERIDAASVKNYEDNPFVPYDMIEQLVTRETVESYLSKLKHENYRTLVDFVFDGTGSRRLFLILSRSKMLPLLSSLSENKFDDGALPVRLESNGGIASIADGPDAPKSYPFFKGAWDLNDCTLLAANQWLFLAPRFGDKTFHFNFTGQQTMPYLRLESNPASSGFFGEVFKAEIHRTHLARKEGDFAEFFDREADNLSQVQEYKSPHLIKPIAAYRINHDRCLIFPWADGGNLDHHWESLNHKAIGPEKVKWFMEQFAGIGSALMELHLTDGDLTDGVKNCIHGDLKPENILLFNDGKPQAMLQIADLGLAAFHEGATNMRGPSGVGTGTSRYKPPEMDRHSENMGSRGRAYDIWSIGCILLEHLVWSTSGHSNLRTFKNHTEFFWAHRPEQPGAEYDVHPYAKCWMEITAQTLEDNTAYKDLLELIHTKLLVLKPSRIEAKELCQRLDEVQRKCRANPSSRPYVPFTKGGNLAVRGKDDDTPDRPPISRPQSDSFDEDAITLVVPSIQDDSGSASSSIIEKNKLGFCDLCSLLWQSTNQAGIKSRWVDLQQGDSLVGIKGGPDLLSLYSEPDLDSAFPGPARLGLPQLLVPGSKEQLRLMKQWLQVCDSAHTMCQRQNDNKPSMPTRLLDVNSLYLADTASVSSSRYAVLSHCWGKLQAGQGLATTKANIGQHKQCVSLEHLPKSFKDAVIITQRLGIRYLWIDSLCIIQDDAADWYYESARMEQVFSDAYVTIGASSALSSVEGFLGDRPTRRCVQLPAPNKSSKLYVCQAIDNFKKHVEQGPLSLRGWVLQERALSRRSIFFTSTQVYWECGTAINCETLSKLQK
ncbi:hypothetical protein PG994_000754 [Apiospora phragmitis]|uniref:Protein kinase domain-containing protein n=1 Tax=Apiospora phragmitis TaxID=2905665 RepID=A0ABR1X7D4_9PEZI